MLRNPRARLLALGIGGALGMAAISWAVFTDSWSGFGRVVATALFYVLPMMGIQILVERPILRLVKQTRPPLDWIVFAGLELAAIAAATSIATALMLLVGFTTWRELFLANRVVIAVGLVATCAGRFFQSTKQRLEERSRQAEAKAAEVGRELRDQQEDFERAREIQEALVPKQLPIIPGCDLAAGWQPARMVGGDYFDVIPLKGNKVGIAIGDVSGKGMGAALLMSNLQAIVRSFAASAESAAELCARTNQFMTANIAPGKFITFFYAVADLDRKRLDYCGAGHNPPILARGSDQLERLTEGGPVLGIFPRATYAGAAVPLQPGDCLVLYTDGISEAMNREQEEFGDDRLVALLQRCSSQSAGELRKSIMAAVTEFTEGAFQDDATLLIMRV